MAIPRQDKTSKVTVISEHFFTGRINAREYSYFSMEIPSYFQNRTLGDVN